MLHGTAPQRGLLLLALGALVLAVSCGGLRGVRFDKAQRWPGPMESTADPLPPGSETLYPQGPEEVIVVRHADAVHVRPAGAAGSYPLTFYDRQRRLNAGSWLFSMPGGRMELIWPDGSSAYLYDRTTAVIGSPSRGEPLLLLWELDYARFQLGAGDSVSLVSGAVLRSGEGLAVVERAGAEIERVRNQGKSEVYVDYRDETFVLDPGQMIDLPLIASRAEPLAVIPGARTVASDSFMIDVLGEVSVLEEERGVRLIVEGEHQIRGLGVRVRLLEGEQVVFEPLGASDELWLPPYQDLPRGATYRGEDPPVEERVRAEREAARRALEEARASGDGGTGDVTPEELDR